MSYVLSDVEGHNQQPELQLWLRHAAALHHREQYANHEVKDSLLAVGNGLGCSLLLGVNNSGDDDGGDVVQSVFRSRLNQQQLLARHGVTPSQSYFQTTLSSLKHEIDVRMEHLRRHESALDGISEEANLLLARLALGPCGGAHGNTTTTSRSTEAPNRSPTVVSGTTTDNQKEATKPHTLRHDDKTAIEAYDQFLTAHNGSSLGWPQGDHDLFLRCFLQCQEHRSALDVFEMLCDALAHISQEEIWQHLQLYSEMMRLLSVKRQAILAFQQQRQADAENEKHIATLRHEAEANRQRHEEAIREQQRLRRQEYLHKKIHERRRAEIDGQAQPPDGSNLKSEVETALRPQTTENTRKPLQGLPHPLQGLPHRVHGIRPQSALSRMEQQEPPQALSSSSVATIMRSPSRDRTSNATIIASAALTSRWEESKQRAELRRAKIALAHEKQNTARSELLHLLVEEKLHGKHHDDDGTDEKSSHPRRCTSSSSSARLHGTLTASAAAHRREAANTSNHDRAFASVGGGGGGGGKPMNHRAASEWCDRSYLR